MKLETFFFTQIEAKRASESHAAPESSNATPDSATDEISVNHNVSLDTSNNTKVADLRSSFRQFADIDESLREMVDSKNAEDEIINKTDANRDKVRFVVIGDLERR